MYLTIALFNLNGGYDPSTYVKLITTKYISKFVSAVYFFMIKTGTSLPRSIVMKSPVTRKKIPLSTSTQPWETTA